LSQRKLGQAWDKVGTTSKASSQLVSQNSQMSPTIESVQKALLIRFDQPEIRNPLSVEVVDFILKSLEQIDAGSVTKVVFTGSGDAFASGANLREIAKLNPASARAFAECGQMLMNKIDKLHLPTIAAIDGFCFGGGLDLALACNARIASPKAVFCHPGVSLGIITGWGGTQRLPRLIGEARATEMFLTGDRIDAKEALRMGLVNSISHRPLAAALEKVGEAR
jgi:enoyl-CoA hydratase